ncbi:fluoride efflux transporter CrcB [Nakamurella deserti]|uniref:fluoride efflux transporter CrcB n=1 Tax=Nakamurella deserti TaxID=2164074 RepID=UPI000DBE48B4|nr:fluoride efflux transporter CrcB [Nakamurella deserti]
MTRQPPPASGHRERPDDVDALPPTPSTGSVLAVVAVGGVIGALARHQVGRSWPAPPTNFPWSTLAVNVSGCLLIGVLLGVLADRPRAHPLLRPLLGTGVLGGYTTFSTYTVDLHRLLTTGHVGTAAMYLLGTLAAALTATVTGMCLGRRRGRR